MIPELLLAASRIPEVAFLCHKIVPTVDEEGV